MMYIVPQRPMPRAIAANNLSYTGTPRATRRCLQGGNDVVTPPSPDPKVGPRVSPDREGVGSGLRQCLQEENDAHKRRRCQPRTKQGFLPTQTTIQARSLSNESDTAAGGE